jgi:hypothetical protein
MAAGYLSDDPNLSAAEQPDDPFPVKLAKRARVQAEWCTKLGSRLYGDLIARAAEDIAAGGPFSALMTDPAMHPEEHVPMLRLMGAAHRLALTGRAPELASAYAAGDHDAAWDALLALGRDRPDELREGILQPVQTNEVGRCGALAPGFAYIARETGLPLRLLEIGASAGLNLRFDLYRYDTGRAVWGPEDSPVRVTGFWQYGEPPFDDDVAVIERRGCDPSPVDPTTEEGRLTLLTYVWPDQRDRVANLRGALALAPGVPAPVERAGALEWVERELAELPSGAVTVVYHSIVMPYLPHDDQEAFAAAVSRAGEERATPDAPLAWLSMEHGGEECELRLTLWPGPEHRVLASCGFHGRNVVWQA